jgi:hypothetical protein
MKKIITIAMLLPTMIFAQQENDSTKVANFEKFTLSVALSVSEPATFGLSVERFDKIEKGFNSCLIANISFGAMTVNTFDEVTGTGFVIDSGKRQYLKKGKVDGFYSENFLTYGRIKFDQEMIAGVQDQFVGTYSYWSLINPNIGYKLNAGKFSIDGFAGFNWKWEVRGKGDFDNNLTENFVARVGIKAGYRF